jgi:hypothetical protein
VIRAFAAGLLALCAGNAPAMAQEAPSDASAVFFRSGGAPANDPDSVTRHRNGALALAEAWVEGRPLLDSLLMELGARRSGEVERAEGRHGTRWELSAGSIVVSRPAPDGWPRPLGAVVARTRLAAVPVSGQQLSNGFWIVLTNGDADE